MALVLGRGGRLVQPALHESALGPEVCVRLGAESLRAFQKSHFQALRQRRLLRLVLGLEDRRLGLERRVPVNDAAQLAGEVEPYSAGLLIIRASVQQRAAAVRPRRISDGRSGRRRRRGLR